MKRKAFVLFLSAVIFASLLTIPIQASPGVIVKNIFPWYGFPTTLGYRLPYSDDVYYATLQISKGDVVIVTTVRVRHGFTALSLNVDGSLKGASVTLLTPVV